MVNVVVHEYVVMKLTQLEEKFKAKHLPHSGLKFDRVVRLFHHDFGTVPESPSPATASNNPENTNFPAAPPIAMAEETL